MVWVLLLVGQDGCAVVDEEGVVGEVEAQRIPRGRRRGVLPHLVHLVVQEQEPVVAAVGDQEPGPEIR